MYPNIRTDYRMHMGRSWEPDTNLEVACPCPKAKCGLVADPTPSCSEHWNVLGESIRQLHWEDQCAANLPPYNFG